MIETVMPDAATPDPQPPALWADDSGPWDDGMRDLAGGLRRRYMWASLGWFDVRQRYSGSMLGSMWLTANTALTVVCLTFIFATTMGVSHGSYAAYVTIGLILWSFIQATLNEASMVFISTAETLRQCTVPASVQLFRLMWRNLIAFAHAALLVPVVLVLFAIRPSAAVWTIVPALALLVTALFFAAVTLSLLGARFRDVPQVVTNALQLMFFVTPIFWLPSALAGRSAWLVQKNPAYAFIDIVRAPLLGESVAAASWPIALASTAILVVVGLFAYKAWRSRLVYWI